MVALMCWTMAAGWVPPMRTHSVSIAAAAAALSATQLKQPRGAPPRCQSARRRKIAAPLSVAGGLAPPFGHDKRGAIVQEGGAGPSSMGIATALFALAAAAITAAWAWLGATRQMPPSPLAAGAQPHFASSPPLP